MRKPIGNHSLGITSGQMSDSMLKREVFEFSAAEVIASNTAFPVIGANADGNKALVFEGAEVIVIGGSVAYDTNQTFKVQYTDDSGTVASLTLTNFLNGAAAGAGKTFKPLATDIALTYGANLVLVSSASPKTTVGDMKLRVYTTYRVVSKT